MSKKEAYVNKTFALTFSEGGKWLFAKSKDSVISGKGIESLINLICSQTKSEKRKIIVWNFRLSEMVIWAGEESFEHVEKHTLRGYIIKYADFKNVKFKNTKEFYRMPLAELRQKKKLSFKNELAIVWHCAEAERLKNGGKVSRIPDTAIGYVSRQINGLAGFGARGAELYRLGLSIDDETHKIISDCKNGGLCGVDFDRIDYSCVVNSYDFKSFYPWIMTTQLFPHSRYICIHGLQEKSFRFWRFNEKAKNGELRWIGRAKFAFIRAKGIDWLKFDSAIKDTYTFTDLDFRIIQRDYDYIIEEFTHFIPFEACQKLPGSLRGYIKEQFTVKERFEEGSAEYEEAKIFLNSIFGLFCQNHLVYGKSADCFTAKQRPLVIGVFVAAYGRFFLWDIARQHNPLAWDTDGFKTEDTLDLDLFNERRETIGRMGKLLCEAEYTDCTVFGNKQYILNGELKLSGTDGKLATEYCRIHGIEPHVGTVIPPEYTNRVIIQEKKTVNVSYTIGRKFYEEENYEFEN